MCSLKLKPIQLIPIICIFHIYKFTYSLKSICNLQTHTLGPFMVICRHVQRREKSEWPNLHTFPTEDERADALPSYFGPHTINKCSFHGIFTATHFILLCFSEGIPLKNGSQVQYGNAIECPKHKRL